MRITSANAFETSVKTLQQRQQELTQAQTRLTSGKRVLHASDDPAAAARAERALALQSRSEASQRGLLASRNAMQQAESTLGSATDLVQQARELVLAAGNPTYGDAERRQLGAQLRGLREQLLSLANRGDGAGGYLFGGQGSAQPPFVDTPTGVVFRGVSGQALVAAGDPMPMSLDGGAGWLQANSGIFSALDDVAERLQTGNLSDAQITQAVQNGLRDIDAAFGGLQLQRAAAGASLNRLDGIEQRLADTKLAAQTERSTAEDLDMVQALSDFQNKQTGYDAALKSYSLVQRLSLLQYLNV